MVSLLERRAAEGPKRPFIVMDKDDSRTYGRFNADANRLAHGLADFGVGIGDHVVSMLGNGLESLLATFALRKLGAIEVSVPRRMQDAELLFVLEKSRPTLAIVESRLVAAVEGYFPGLRVIPYGAVASSDDRNLSIEFPDTQTDAVLFTPGTTGPAKGCILSHRAGVTMGLGIARSLRFREEDCLYCPYPLGYIDSRYLTVGAALWAGARVAIGRRFGVDGFWEEIRNLEVTVFEFMGNALTMLWNQPPEPTDLDNPVRLAWGVPPPPFAPLFEERFGLRLATCYGSTDAGVATWRDPDLRGEPFNSSGRVVEPYEVRIGDDQGEPLPVGAVGEILVRADVGDVMMKGYLGMPGMTAETFRNGWLHTGDYGRLDADGRLYFEGRKAESIRRHGEHVSPWEVEQALEAHPDVLEAVAVGVPGGSGDEDVCAYLVLKEGVALSAASLREFLRPRIAEPLMPSTFRVVREFPKTDTGKPQRFRLAPAGRRTTHLSNSWRGSRRRR